MPLALMQILVIHPRMKDRMIATRSKKITDFGGMHTFFDSLEAGALNLLRLGRLADLWGRLVILISEFFPNTCSESFLNSIYLFYTKTNA